MAKKRSSGGLHGIVNGTSYKDDTPPAVIGVLESARDKRQRICVLYGDKKTGRAWGDKECGYVGRSTGSIKIPLLVHNKRSMGGGGVLDDAIVKITTTTKPKRVLYQHPKFRLPLPVLGRARR